MRILGIDPGSRATGYGVVDVRGSHIARVASGVIRVKGEELGERLAGIADALEVVIGRAEPEAAALESVFAAHNARSALLLGHARGAALAGFAEIEVMRTNPPLATPRDSRLVEALAGAQVAAGLGRRLGTKATCTEAGLLSEAGLEAVVFGPGPSVGNVHKPNEHTRISELELARDVYRGAILSLCTDGLCPEEDGSCSS